MNQVATITSEKIRSQLVQSVQAFELLGKLLVWKIKDVNISYADFLERMKAVGFSEDFAPKVQTKSALIRAIRQYVAVRPGVRYINVLENEERVAFVIYHPVITNTQTIDAHFETETRVILDKETKVVQIDGPNKAEIEQTFAALQDVYTSDRFRNVVIKIVRSSLKGFSYRDRGGIYFAPAFHQEGIEKLQKLFAAFPGCTLEILPVPNMEEAKQTLWKALVSDVREELEKFQEDVKGLGDETSDRSIRIRMERAQEMQEKVRAYSSLLSGTAEELQEELAKATDELLAKAKKDEGEE